MEAGIEGFRCDCRFAKHSNERWGIWLPTRGVCPACQMLTEREGVNECTCACTACTTSKCAANFPCRCTQTTSQQQHCSARFTIPNVLCNDCQLDMWGECNCHCRACDDWENISESSSHSSTSPRLGNRTHLCYCNTGRGSHGCRNSIEGSEGELSIMQ